MTDNREVKVQYLMVRQRVRDFDHWMDVFRSHKQAQQAAGLWHPVVMRDATDPAMVTCLLEVHDPDRAREFVSAPQADAAADYAGVLGTPEIKWLSEPEPH